MRGEMKSRNNNNNTTTACATTYSEQLASATLPKKLGFGNCVRKLDYPKQLAPWTETNTLESFSAYLGEVGCRPCAEVQRPLRLDPSCRDCIADTQRFPAQADLLRESPGGWNDIAESMRRGTSMQLVTKPTPCVYCPTNSRDAPCFTLCEENYCRI